MRNFYVEVIHGIFTVLYNINAQTIRFIKQLFYKPFFMIFIVKHRVNFSKLYMSRFKTFYEKVPICFIVEVDNAGHSIQALLMERFVIRISCKYK